MALSLTSILKYHHLVWNNFTVLQWVCCQSRPRSRTLLHWIDTVVQYVFNVSSPNNMLVFTADGCFAVLVVLVGWMLWHLCLVVDLCFLDFLWYILAGSGVWLCQGLQVV